jgi:proteasome lid subunit RPN8/RPN11
MLILADELAAQIAREGEAVYPDECCGILLGLLDDHDELRAVTKLLPQTNRRESREKFHRFRIEAEDFLLAEQTARRERLEVLGIYHSHPDHPAVPSENDREHALPFYSYFIVSIEAGKATTQHSWRLNAQREFEAEMIVAARKPAP